MSKKLKLNQDLKLIIDLLNTNVNSEIISIVLYGSYGRGEGAFYNIGDETFTYNDYDLLLIVSELIDEKKISELKNLISVKTYIKWIDLSQMLQSNLRYLKPTIFNYDLKYGSKVIWGNTSVLNYININKSSKIPYCEIETLYFTRLYTFIGSLKKDSFKTGVKSEESRFFRYQMAKAIFSVVDCELILAQQYSHSYREKANLISSFKPELKDLSKWALKEKLSPINPDMNNEDVIALYTEVIQAFHKSMHKGLSKLYKRDIISTKKHIFYFNFSVKHIFVLLKSLIKKKIYFNYLKYYKINFAQAFIVEYYVSKLDSNNYMLSYVTQIIKKYSNLNLEDTVSWNELRFRLSQFLNIHR